MKATPQQHSAGRAVICLLVALAATVGVGIPIYRAASQSSTFTNDTTPVFASYAKSIPAAVLQLLQKQAASPPWNQDTPAKTKHILQRCALLQQLLASGATDETLGSLLATNTMRASIFMAFGQSLYNTGDTHHAEMFYATVVQSHTNHVTAKELARCYLWLGKLYQGDGLASKYQQANPAQASTLFQTAAANYLSAKDASQDWVRGSGWLGAAACYREMGNQAMRRLCLTSLLQELATNNIALSGADTTLGPVWQDTASYLLASSFYEDHRYTEASRLYSQILARITAQLSTNSAQYPGQGTYTNLANAGLNSCVARLTEQRATNLPPTAESQIAP